MKNVSWRSRLQYAFDNSMSKGPTALIGWLGILSLALIAVAGAIVSLLRIPAEAGGEPVGFFEGAWLSLMRTLDAGTMGGDTGWGFRFLMLLVTIGGIFVISTLIGILTTSLESRLEQLRKGRSRVLEEEHTLILGWSSQIFTIISELAAANANRTKPCIVILAEKDKVEMQDEIIERVGDLKNTRLVCRTGSPIEMTDLDIVNVQGARSIIILSPEDDDPDSQVIKTLLAITNNPLRRKEPYHIVAEIRDQCNLDVAKMVGRDEVELVSVGDLIARIMAQTCRQSGLSVVYIELLDFGGDEIYYTEEPGLIGKTYGESLLAYEDSAIIGLCPKGACAQLNPPMDTIIQTGDKLIAISEDDDTIRLGDPARRFVDPAAILAGAPATDEPEQTLILGWNWRVPLILRELDHYVPAGSIAHVVADFPKAEAEELIAHECAQPDHLTVSYQEDDTTDRRVLDDLQVTSFDHVILLCYSDTLEPQKADARTLITLLHLRDIADKQGHPFSIVSEMLDIRNRNLAEATRADDFIVSDKLVSLMMSQISENKGLNAVFQDMFDPEGAEIYLKPASQYVQLGQPVSFYTVVESARRQGSTAIGYRLHALSSQADSSYGVFINPKKSDLITFGESDRIIAVAEE